MLKTIETHLGRKFTVQDDRTTSAVIVEVKNAGSGAEIASRLCNADAVELGEVVLKAAGKNAFVFEGRLPNASGDGVNVKAGSHMRSLRTSPDEITEEIKALITIRDVLILEAEEKKQREAEEALAVLKLKNRRDELVNRFAGTTTRSYSTATEILRDAVDYAIELEDKLAEADKNA